MLVWLYQVVSYDIDPNIVVYVFAVHFQAGVTYDVCTRLKCIPNCKLSPDNVVATQPTENSS